MNWYDVAALLIGGAGGGGLLQSRQDRRAAAAQARAQRLFAMRLEAYREAGRMLQRLRIYLERVHPIIQFGDALPIPRDYSDDEWEALLSSIRIASTSAILDAIDDAHQKVREFQGAVMVFESMQQQHATPVQITESRQQMYAARDEALAVIVDAEQKMRAELAAL